MKDISNDVISEIEGIMKLDSAKRNPIQKKFLAALKQIDENLDYIKVELLNAKLFSNGLIQKIQPLDEASKNKIVVALKKRFNKEDTNLVYYRVVYEEDKESIRIKLSKPSSEVPVEIFQFIKTVEQTERAIRFLYKSEEKERLSFIASLVGLSSIGGTSTYQLLAKQQLDEMRQEIILQKGNKIKVEYIKIFGIVTGIIALLFLWYFSSYDLFASFDYYQLMCNCFIAIIGANIGLIVSFAIRKREIAFEDLRILSTSKHNPIIRNFILSLIAVIMYFLLATEIVNVDIGNNFSTKDINEKDYMGVAFVVGIFIGLAEKNIGVSLTKKAESFVSKI